MSVATDRDEVRRINRRLSDLRHEELELIRQRDSVEDHARTACKHEKIVYVDGHPHQSWDYDWDHYHAEMHICLSCGLTEEGKESQQQSWLGNAKWDYKVLTGKPIRRFCVVGNAGLQGTIDYEKRANSTFGESTYEERMCHYWAYVRDKLFAMPYASRVKKMRTWGYPA